MSDLSFSMLLRLMDGWSGPADKVRNSMRRLSNSAKTMQRDLGRKVRTGFSEAQLEAALTRSEVRISKHRQRLLGASAMLASVGAPVIQAGNYEERLIDFANLAEIGEERVKKLDEQLDALRKTTGQSKLGALQGLEVYVGKGMGLDEALAGMEATGKAAKATKSAMGEMANSGFAVMDNLDIAPDSLRKAFDIMAKSGKEGSFELSAMARKFPEITAGAKSLKMEGLDSVASLSAALQIAMKAAGSEDQAATNMTNFLGKITAPDTVKKFREFGKLGVDVEKEMRIALERGADPLEHMLLVIEEMTGGDAFKMGELFADKQVLDFLRAMIPNMEEYQRIKQTALGADGVIDKDFEEVMKGFNEEWRQLRNSVSSLTTKSGVLLPIFTDIMSQMRMGVETVAEWTAANPELTETLVKGAAALLLFGAGTRVISFAWAVMAGGLLRTAALFFKFNKQGRNVAILGRGVSLLTRGVGGLGRALGKLGLLRALTPNFGPALANFSGFRTSAASEVTKLSRHVNSRSIAMQRSLSRVRWKALGTAGLVYAAMSSIPDDPKDLQEFQKKNAEAMERGFRKTPVISQMMGAYDWIFEKVHGKPPPSATAHLEPKLSTAPSASPEVVDLIAEQNALKAEIRALESRLAQIKDGPLSATLKQPLQQEMAVLQSDLAEIGNEIRTAGAINAGLAPITQAIRNGMESGLSVTSSLRPNARPGNGELAAVSFQNNPQLDVKVSLDMPVSITREQQISNQELAKRAGEQVGAETERAIRRGLDDAALAE